MSNVVSYLLPNLSIFCTTYTIVALVVLYPYFLNKKKFFIIVIVFAFLFDIVYTNTLFLNVIIFSLAFLINAYITYLLPDNLLNTNIKGIITIFSYNILTFLILTIIGYSKYSLLVLVKVLYSNIIITCLYTTVLYLILKKIRIKFIR